MEYTTGQAANIAEVTSAQVRSWQAKGLIFPSSQTPGGHSRWDEACIRRLKQLAKGSTSSSIHFHEIATDPLLGCDDWSESLARAEMIIQHAHSCDANPSSFTHSYLSKQLLAIVLYTASHAKEPLIRVQKWLMEINSATTKQDIASVLAWCEASGFDNSVEVRIFWQGYSDRDRVERSSYADYALAALDLI